MTKCPQCNREVEPVMHSTGSHWYSAGECGDNIHDALVCPLCGCEIPDDPQPITPSQIDDVPF